MPASSPARRASRAALDHFGVKRIGHGVRAIEDPALVERLAREGIVLELCPSSNVALGLYPDIAHHPFRRLMEAGVRVTINSDDPPYFHTSLGGEYDSARRAISGLDAAALTGATRTAIEAAFVDEATRASSSPRSTRRRHRPPAIRKAERGDSRPQDKSIDFFVLIARLPAVTAVTGTPLVCDPRHCGGTGPGRIFSFIERRGRQRPQRSKGERP